MIKVVVKDDFTLGEFKALQNLVRKNENNNEKGRLYTGDEFECTEKMCEYLTRTNSDKHAYVEVIEIVPDEKVKKKPILVTEVKEEKKVAKKRPVAKKEK